MNHTGKMLALVESSLPYQITNELETVGVYDFAGKLADSMTAHPKICPRSGELHFFGYGSLTSPSVTYHRVNAAGDLITNRGLDVRGLTMMHDFALSAEHIVFMDLPVVFRLDIARNGQHDMPYRWSDNYGARLGVLRREDPFGPIRWFDIKPCYVFHVLNAFDKTTDDGKPLVLQAARYRELWRDNGAPGFDAVMWFWTINLSRGTVTEQQLDDRPVEFPRIDDRLVGMPARYGVTWLRVNLYATTSNAVPLRSTLSVAPLSPVDLVRPSSLRPIRTLANSPAGICPMSTTRFGTAAIL